MPMTKSKKVTKIKSIRRLRLRLSVSKCDLFNKFRYSKVNTIQNLEIDVLVLDSMKHTMLNILKKGNIPEYLKSHRSEKDLITRVNNLVNSNKHVKKQLKIALSDPESFAKKNAHFDENYKSLNKAFAEQERLFKKHGACIFLKSWHDDQILQKTNESAEELFYDGGVLMNREACQSLWKPATVLNEEGIMIDGLDLVQLHNKSVENDKVVEETRVKAPKSMFRLMLEQKDLETRSAKKDEETEESDEEEGQRGLGDFGFGTMSELREMDEDQDPLKLRRGDLDHIVDEVDRENDEDAAAKAAVDMEIAEDRQRRKDVIFKLEQEDRKARSAKVFPSLVSMFRLKIVHKDDIVN